MIPGVGIVTSGLDAARARTTRDLYHRAIVVQDAAEALGGFRSLSEAEAFAIEYWPLERYKLAQAPPPGELVGAHRAGHRRGQRDRPSDGATARLARRARRGRRPERATAPRRSPNELVAGIRRSPRPRRRVDVTSEDDVVAMVRRTVLEYGGLDFLVASAGLATSAAVTATTLDDWERSYAVLARGYFLAAREAFRVLSSRAAAARSSSSARRTRSSQERTPPRTPRRKRRRSTSGAASPRRAARTGSASTP